MTCTICKQELSQSMISALDVLSVHSSCFCPCGRGGVGGEPNGGKINYTKIGYLSSPEEIILVDRMCVFVITVKLNHADIDNISRNMAKTRSLNNGIE